MTRLRSGKTTSDVEDKTFTNNLHVNDSDLSQEEEEILSDQKANQEANHASRSKKRSPYAKLREELNELDESNVLNGLKKR